MCATPQPDTTGTTLAAQVQRWMDRLGYGHLDCWADPELLDHLHSHAMQALDADGVPEEQQAELAVARVADTLVVLYGGSTQARTNDFLALLALARTDLEALGRGWNEMYGPNEALTSAYEELDSMEREYRGS